MQLNRVYEFGPFRLDAADRLLLRAGEAVPLTPKAFDLLLTLLAQPGHLLDKEALLKAVWPDSFVEENNLADNISKLRKALGEGANGQKFIETVPKRGYRFVAEVRELNGVGQDAILSHKAAPDSRRALLRKGGVVLLAVLSLAAARWFWLGNRQRPLGSLEMKATILTNDNNVRGASLSPDGKQFVYVDTDEQSARLWLQQVAGGAPVQLGPPYSLEHRIFGMTFSPDGEWLYFTTINPGETEGALYRIPVSGGTVTKVLSDIASPITFAPDGKQMAFIRSGHAGQLVTTTLLIADNAGGNERVVLTRTEMERLGGYASWSPDSAEILCTELVGPTATSGITSRIIGVNAQSGATRLLTPQAWDGCGRAAWLRDGSGFVVAGTRHGEMVTGRDALWFVPQPVGPLRRLSADNNRHAYDSLSVSQDGQTLLTLAGNYASQIWSVPRATAGRYETRDAAQLTTGVNEGRAGLLSLTDGRIVYAARTGDQLGLWQLRPSNTPGKGGPPQQLTSEPFFLEELTAPADGSFFLYSSNRASNAHLFRYAGDGTQMQQLTSGASYEIASSCAPDGSWLAYAAAPAVAGGIDHFQLWRMPAAGGLATRLTDFDADVPHISPDGQWVSYVAYDLAAKGWQFGVIPATGGAPVKRFRFALASQAHTGLGAQWTPDGKALTYLVTQKFVSNIWAQPLGGGVPYPLTNFTSGLIYRYAFARNGQTLYLARGYPTNDAVLIRNFR